MEKKHIGKNTGRNLYIGILVFTLFLNLLAWCSRAFCDWYTATVFPFWVGTYGRLTGLFPFSVGEWMIAAGLLLLCAAVGVGIYGLIRHRFARKFYTFFAWVLLGIWLVLTLNCFILYHATPFSEKYLGESPMQGESAAEQEELLGNGGDSLRELLRVRNMVVENCNALSGQIERNESGQAVYSGGIAADGSRADMNDMAIETMQKLGQVYRQLDGYYPRPKPIFFSDFMCQQHMCGYYFPFSMEANYNDVMYVLNKPSTMCHELAHLRGFIYEDEANFVSYLACVGSDDVFFQYSGYLSVLVYLENDLYRAYEADPEGFAAAAEQTGLAEVLPIVWEDNIFVEQKEWERIDKKAVLETDTIDQVTDTFMDASLKINGVSDGAVSYSRVVDLLLLYYRENGK